MSASPWGHRSRLHRHLSNTKKKKAKRGVSSDMHHKHQLVIYKELQIKQKM